MGRLLRLGEPGRGVEMETGLHALGAGAQLLRKGDQQLQLGSRHGGTEAEIGGRPGQAGQEKRLGLARLEAVQPRPIAVEQSIAAFRPALAIDRNAGRTQRVDVAIDRAQRDLAGFGQHLRRDPAARLEGGEDGEQPARSHAETLAQPDTN
jgi:hypothetical protein